MRYKSLIRGGASAMVLAGLAAGGTAFAQEEEDVTTVDTLIVTAQKREQLLQDVPIVVTVVGEALLEDNGIKDIKDLQVLTPGLIVTSTSNESVTTARIRGVGTVGDNPGLESSVGIVIDGVYRPRNGVSFGDLGELQRIEVLKGPQGTLFGKNTSAGVVSVITKEPEFDFLAETELTGGNYGHIRVSQSVTGPLGENTAGRLFVAYNQRDGFYDVTPTAPRTAREDATQDYYTVRGQLLWFPNNNSAYRLIADYSDRDELCCLAVHTNVGVTAPAVNFLAGGAGVASPANPFARDTFANRNTEQQIEDMGLSLQGDWDLDFAGGSTLTSITAIRNWSTMNGQDSDFSGADILYRPVAAFGREFDQLSQEIRLNGQSGDLNWLVGAFYADEDLHSDEGLRLGDQLESYINLLISPAPLSLFTGLAPGTNFPTGSGGQDTYDQAATSWAVFTNNSYQVTDALELTLGLRYTSEDKDLRAQYDNIGGNDAACQGLLDNEVANATLLGGGDPAAGRASQGYAVIYGFTCLPTNRPAFDGVTTNQSRSEDELTGTLKAAYRWNDQLMTYASYARGYKSGGFNLDRSSTGNTVAGFGVNPDTSFAAEIADSYELGFKSTLSDNLLLNGTAFYQEYQGFQLNTFTGISFIVASIPEVTSKGADLDLIWTTPVDGLSLQGGITYADTKYGNFTPTPGVSPNLPGNRISFAPLWTASLAGSYERPLNNGLWLRTSLSARYTSEYNTGSDLNPAKTQDEFVLMNGRIALEPDDANWSAELWAQNLTDEDYYQVVFDATFQPGTYNAFLGAPGTYGLTLRKRFE
jgi:iron complex outermembrane receptor protein